MSTISIRSLIGCLHGSAARHGTVSVLNHYFGYTAVPGALSQTAKAIAEDISLLRQARRLRKRHFHLKLVFVGNDQADSPAMVHRNFDDAIAYARRVFGGIGIGIGRVRRTEIATGDADGFDHLDSSGQAEDAWASLPGGEDGSVNVFIVREYSSDDADKGGRSPPNGDCSQHCGIVVVFRDAMATMLHELGHYLGDLDHPEVNPSTLDDPMREAAAPGATTRFNEEQAACIRESCCLRDPCP